MELNTFWAATWKDESNFESCVRLHLLSGTQTLIVWLFFCEKLKNRRKCPWIYFRPRLHGDENGKTHRRNANATAKNLPSPRNRHRIVSRDGSVYIQTLEKLQYICRTCTWHCNFLHKSSNFLHKISEEEWLSWLHFCLLSAVGADRTGQSFSPVNVC